MREWKVHAIVITIILAILQVILINAPLEWLFSILIFDTTTSVVSVVYGVAAYRKFELASEKLKPVFTSRVLKIADASFAAMTPKRQAQVERNLEQLVALGMVYVDRIGEMSEEQFGEFIGRTVGVKLRVTPEDLRAKIRMVSGY